MRAELRCAWCGCKINPRHVTRANGQTLCSRRFLTSPPRCADYLIDEPIADADRNPPRPATVYVPCD